MKLLYFVSLFVLAIFCNGFAEINVHPTEMQLILNTLCQTHHLPGLQASIKDIETGQSWDFSSGYKDLRTLESLKIDHLMQIGSTTKSFMACLALLLEADSEMGCLDATFNIDQTVGDWLPQYPEWKLIKIKNLLNMTSGIYNYTEDKNLFQEILKTPHRTWQDHELIDLAYSHNPNIQFPAGTKYAYSNTNYILVGMILEKVTGVQLETLLNERILQKYPDLFRHTSYSPKTYPSKEMQNMAHGYSMNDKKHPEFYQQDTTAMSLSYASAAGALTSTASDLVNWIGLLFSENFLPKKQWREFTDLICAEKNQEATPLSNDSKLMGYGLGIMRVYDPVFGYTWTHTGGTLGYHTLFIYIPQKTMIISVIINQDGPKIDGKEDIIFIAHQVFAAL